MNEVLGMVRSFGIAKLISIAGVALCVALMIYFFTVRVTAEPMALLYADLDLKDGADIAARLEQDGVRHDLREANGAVSVYVPSPDRARLKLALAADGFVATSGSIGYEIFDTQDALGVTSFQQSISKLRALEGEIARTIATLSGVRSARVHLVLPERELFSRDKESASASIVIDAPGGLDKRSVRAIVNLAASAVPGLSPSRVTVLDQAGDLLASGQEGDDPLATAGGADERIIAAEARIRRTIEDMVGRIVGPENLRVQVAAELDFSRITETANIIDPDSQTVLSSTTVEDQSNDNDPALVRGVTIANQLPETAVVDPNAAASATSSARRIEETTNFEMTRTVRSEVREIGGVRRLSVAVALNAGPAPRTEADIARIEALVRAAVGYNPARGDQINVVETSFQPLAATTPEPAGELATAQPSAASADALLRAGEIAAFGAVIFALCFFVLRPLLMSNTAAQPAPAAITATGTRIEALPSPAAANAAAAASVDPRLTATSVRRVAEVIKTNTDESAGILKSWIRKAS
ncbi:MAG: flagellar basal-body MS-ring/collar protein FliF [Parvularculaceae bacterium]